MPRLLFQNEIWSKLGKIILQKRIYNKPNLRLSVEAMYYRIRTGCAWRDLPESFGRWNSIYKKFNAWSKQKKWQSFFKILVSDPDTEWHFIDGSYVKAHQHSSGSATLDTEAIGKSRAGNTSKIHLAVDGYGLPIEFIVTGGEVHDCSVAPQLIEKLQAADVIIADKGYDSQAIRELIDKRGSKSVIPRRSNSVTGNKEMDWGLYKNRHLVENAFARLKHFRGLATRYDKLKLNYERVIAMVCTFLWLPI